MGVGTGDGIATEPSSEKALHPLQTDALLAPPNLDEFRSSSRSVGLSAVGRGKGFRFVLRLLSMCGCVQNAGHITIHHHHHHQWPPRTAPQPINFARFRQGGMPMPRCVRPLRRPRPGQEHDGIRFQTLLASSLRCRTCWLVVVVSH